MLNKYLIAKSETLINVLKKIDNNKNGFLIVIDDENRVFGSISDGDIRRFLLLYHTLDSSAEKIAVKISEYLEVTSSFDQVVEKFKSPKINYLPVVDKNFRLVNILTKKQFHLMLLEDLEFDLKKELVEFNDKILEHEIYNRPWGFYKSTFLTNLAQAKVITVFPNASLSLQEHKKREEHWVIIKGRGKVILAESVVDVYPGKYIFIPKGCKHQISNDSNNENLIFSEVQLGIYFGEDDIIRYTDIYGRATERKITP